MRCISYGVLKAVISVSALSFKVFSNKKMKNSILAVVLIVSAFGAFPAVYAEQSTAQDLTMGFIKMRCRWIYQKYNVAFTKQSTFELPNGRNEVDVVQYIFDSNGTINWWM